MPESSQRNSSRKKNQAVDLDTIGLEMGNKPPQALDVEEAVLGAMLIEPVAVDQAMEELSASCFYDKRHQMIFEGISSLVLEHTPVDIITVSTKLKEKGTLEDVGGPVYLATLSQKVGAEADPTNFLLMHAMGPNVAGVIGTAVAAGTFMAIFGVF